MPIKYSQKKKIKLAKLHFTFKCQLYLPLPNGTFSNQTTYFSHEMSNWLMHVVLSEIFQGY